MAPAQVNRHGWLNRPPVTRQLRIFMGKHGDPLRFAFVGSTGSTSVPLGVFIPGSNTPYIPSPTDFFYLESLIAWSPDNATMSVVSATGITFAQITSSTILLSFNPGLGFWEDVSSEALSGPQGVVPSVIASISTAMCLVGGTGHVVHSPGTSRPSWMAPALPDNSGR